MPQSINCRGKLLSFERPRVMGILNVTPDSFFDGGTYAKDSLLERVQTMVKDGADIIDVGGMSTRPGASIISSEEECSRIVPVIENLLHLFPDVLLSVDTIHAATAHEVLRKGVHIINDVSGGSYDPKMMEVVANFDAPYILMHMKGLPATMQHNPVYDNVLNEVINTLADGVSKCRKSGIKDVIVDPGFGFGKSIEHNYTLLRDLSCLRALDCPVLAGVSRKSMISKALGVSTEKSLNGTTVANTIALINGASILRVHDVREAIEAVEIYSRTFPN